MSPSAERTTPQSSTVRLPGCCFAETSPGYVSRGNCVGSLHRNASACEADTAYVWPIQGTFSVVQDAEVIAQELSALGHKLDELEKRMAAVEKVNRRLEEAALTTARALGEISGHWDAVYEAMRRKDESQEAAKH
jgi:hypothetical protein